ncbi:L-threonine O-3-phosphate decarboxylase [Anaerovirgula multivorans]|uniref:threonine-phosphate decarboxylase n=1 Tax=Anaerovirgula multivorans TaxID=312168 RepID=A0A239H6H1_9FIRM|nr:threonine-phosphate decarboxylase CobD [Anaerovirgula multivorans]SNS76822.1 L-threonine O-3-phosphate decarboxylase [Anaerovirgula multivorans]
MTHGGNIFEIQRTRNIDKRNLLDFSANINPLGVPETLATIIRNRIQDLQYYPDIDYHDLKSAISQYYSVEKGHVFLGNGAAQVIFDTIHTIEPKKTIILAPTFSEYERALKAIDSDVVKHSLREEDNFDLNVEELMKSIDDSVDLVVLCNPNNPTSRLIEIKELKQILAECKKHHAYLMIDEAFMDFVEEQQLYSMLRHYRNEEYLIIVRAFTKFYGIPGLRLGFGLCWNDNLLKAIQEKMLPWSLNTFAGYFGEVLLSEEEYVEKTHQWLKKEKRRFIEELHKIEEIKAFTPSVNFILLKIEKYNLTVDVLKEKLLDKNILIRDCSNFTNLNKKFFRVAIKNPQDNNALIKALREISR